MFQVCSFTKDSQSEPEANVGARDLCLKGSLRLFWAGETVLSNTQSMGTIVGIKTG